MIISRGRSYVFVHIPKTGGTSLAQALEERAMRDDILIGDTPKAQRRKGRLKKLEARGRLWKHATLADIDGVLSSTQLTEMFVFTMVRNPWDRLVSYYHWLRVQQFEHPAVICAKSLDFSRFIEADQVQKSLRNSPARSYMTDCSGVVHCAAAIRLEHFEEDAKPLFEHLGFSIRLPHLNASARAADYRGYYTPATRGIVASVCREDIEAFGYAF
ncbi:MAG: sulfotransferase family 2 domain-containing protein [Roseobacter sp.]